MSIATTPRLPGDGVSFVPGPTALDAIASALRDRYPDRATSEIRTATLRVYHNLETDGPAESAPALIDRTLAAMAQRNEARRPAGVYTLATPVRCLGGDHTHPET
jgi:hypothetical protein